MSKFSDILVDEDAKSNASLLREERAGAPSLAEERRAPASDLLSSHRNTLNGGEVHLSDASSKTAKNPAAERALHQLSRKERQRLWRKNTVAKAAAVGGAAARAAGTLTSDRDIEDVAGQKFEEATFRVRPNKDSREDKRARSVNDYRRRSAGKTHARTRKRPNGTGGAKTANEAAASGAKVASASAASATEASAGASNATRAAQHAQSRAAKEETALLRRTAARKQAARRAMMTSGAARRKAASASAEAVQNTGRGLGTRFMRAFKGFGIGAGSAAGGLGVGLGVVMLLVVFIALAVFIGYSDSQSSTIGLDGLNENEAAIATYLSGKGLDNVHVAAIMGNLKQESGCDPLCASSVAIGIAQWGYNVDGSRGNEMELWANSVGKAWFDLDAQLDWMWAEMTNEGNAANQTSAYRERNSSYWMRKFENETDVSEATEIFEVWMEGASAPMMENRIQYAKEYLAIFNAGSGTSSTGIEAVDRAYDYIGNATYIWGACSPGMFDCSGFVSYCLTGEYTRIGTTSTFLGWEQTFDPQPGDVCVNSTHCGIYIGNGQMIDCGLSGVHISTVYSDMIYVRYPG